MLQQQAPFNPSFDEYEREKWLRERTIGISEWNSYCLAACIGTYLTERFLEGTFSSVQEKTFLSLFNNIFGTNFNEKNRDALHAFLASHSFPYVQQMMAIMIIKTYKEDKDNKGLPQNVFTNINNKIGEGFIKLFFQNYFPDISMVKIDELNPDWDSLVKYKDNENICIIIDRKKPYQFNVNIMSLELAKKNGTLERLNRQDSNCQPTIIIDRRKGTVQRWVNHHGKWLSKTYSSQPKNFINAWEKKNPKSKEDKSQNKKEEITQLCVCSVEDIDFMASDTGHTLKKERAAHFELFTNSPKKAQLYNNLTLLYSYPLGNLLPHPLFYGQKIPQTEIKNTDHLSYLAAEQQPTTLYIPDRQIDSTKKSRVYTIPVYRYKTLPVTTRAPVIASVAKQSSSQATLSNVAGSRRRDAPRDDRGEQLPLPDDESLKEDLQEKPALLVVEDQENYMFWGKKDGKFSVKSLTELNQDSQLRLDEWTQYFNQIFIASDDDTILPSLRKLHDFDENNLSKSEHFIVRSTDTEEKYFKYVTQMVCNEINSYIQHRYRDFCKRREKLNTQTSHQTKVKKNKYPYYSYTPPKKHYQQKYHQHKSVKKKEKHQTVITDKKALQKPDAPDNNGSIWPYVLIAIAIIFTGIIPGLLALAGYGIYKATTNKDKKKPPGGNSCHNKTIAQNDSTSKVINETTVHNPTANSLLATTPTVPDSSDAIKIPSPSNHPSSVNNDSPILSKSTKTEDTEDADNAPTVILSTNHEMK